MSEKLLVALLTGVALSSLGCTGTSTCSRGTDAREVPFDSSMLTGNIYSSVPVGGPYTFYPGGRTITFDLDGHLGKEPYAVQFWLAFSSDGTLAPSSGNMTELVPGPNQDEALSPQHVRVFNDTCSDFYLQVVVEAAVCGASICGSSDAVTGAAGAAGATP